MTEEAARPTSGSTNRRPPWVSPEVASIGAASFFSDAGHEIATAVLPSFLTGVLRGSAATVGLIEGLSDALLGLWGWPTPRPGWSWRSPPPSGSAIASRGS